MKKLLFLALLLISAKAQAALATKVMSTFADGRVQWILEYDDVTLQTSTSPIHCINSTSQNSGFIYTTFGNLTNNQAVCAAGMNGGTVIFGGSIGVIQITNLAKDDFDKLQGYFTWPR